MTSYGLLMCTDKTERPSWKDRGARESCLGSARLEAPGDNLREISRKISISSYFRLSYLNILAENI